MQKEYNYKGKTLTLKYSPEFTNVIDKVRVNESKKDKSGKSYYQCRICINGKDFVFSRYIMNETDPKIFIDHINGDPLDNRIENLRTVTPQQNAINVYFSKDTYVFLIEDTKNKCFIANIPEKQKRFSNNYDCIIYINDFIQSSELYGEFIRDKRTLLELATDIPYKTYNREIRNDSSGTCSVCKKFITRNYEEHILICTNLICPDCDSQFSSLSKLTRHKKENCGEKPCQKCGTTFKNKYERVEHVKICEWKCEFCNYHNLEKSNLNLHIKTHHKDGLVTNVDYYAPKPFPCDLCETTCSTKVSLYQHMSRNHKGYNNDKKTVKCEKCDLMYSSTKTMKMHMRTKHVD